MKLIKNLLCIGVFVVAVYSVILMAMPYYRHYALENGLGEAVQFRLKQEEMKALIYKHVEESGAPISKEDVVITFPPGNGAAVSIRWHETIDLFGLYQKRVDFAIDLPEASKPR